MQSQVSQLQGWPHFRGDFIFLPAVMLIILVMLKSYLTMIQMFVQMMKIMNFFLKLKDLTCVMN